jgi:hypothetical protein
MSMSSFSTCNVDGSRREFLRTTGLVAPTLACGGLAALERSARAERQPGKTYESHAVGIRIVPGAWRPHYCWEHIAWISPPWPSQDYLWLDFPEAIFTSAGLLYLSHVNPPIKTLFHDLPRIPWRVISAGIAFERILPNGVAFGGSVTRHDDTTVDLELHLRNDSADELKNITLQTCAFLRAIKEFATYRQDNKLVHVPEAGWITLDQATKRRQGSGTYGVGWRTSGKKVADLPVALVLSNQAPRLIAMTWYHDTLSMVGNAGHPCFHADPRFPDLKPGAEASIRGRLIFFEGPVEEFDFGKYAL